MKHQPITPTHSKWQVERLEQSLTSQSIALSLSNYNRAWKISCDEPNSAYLEVGSRACGDILITDMNLAKLRGYRDAQMIAEEPEIFVGVTCPYEGEVEAGNDNTRAMMNEGTVSVWTSDQPVEFHVEDRVKFINVLLPANRLLKRIPWFSGKLLFIDASRGEAQLIKSYLLALIRVLKQPCPIQEACVSEATIELIANLLRGNDEFNLLDRRRLDLWEKITTYIGDNLDSQDLCPSKVSEEFDVSVRTVHKLFEEQNLTVMRFIKSRRLEAARADLGDPYLKNLSITDLCYKWAFSDAGHFSNAFKSQFGQSPSEYRRSHQG